MMCSQRQRRSAVVRTKIGALRFRRLAASCSIILIALVYLCQPVGATSINSSISVSNPGFDDTTGLVGLPGGDNSLDFTNAYVGWTEIDNTDTPVVGANVGPINVSAGDITSQTTSGPLALYQGNNAVRVVQTTNHVISAASTSFSVSVDVGNDSAGGTFGGYAITLYAENGLGAKTTIKSLTSSVDGGDPADNTYLTKTLTITPADFGAYVGQKIGVALGRESGSRDPFYDSVGLTTTTNGVTIPVSNAGFDDVTGLPGLPGGNNSLDFTNAYVGWTEVDNTGTPVVGANVGPINVDPSDITAQTTSGLLALYQGNAAVRVQQTTNHVISPSDSSVTVGVDVGNDSVGGFAGYVISLYADDGLGTKTTIKTISSSVDGGDPAENAYRNKTLTLSLAELTPYLGQKIGVSLTKEGAGRDPFFDTVTLGATTQGTAIAVVNPGFDDTTGLSGPLASDNDLDFVNAYSGWTEVDNTGTPIVGTNVGPINIAGSDISAQATSGALVLYQGNSGVRIQQTTNHILAANDTSFRLAVDVGNDVIDGFGGYAISLYAEDGLGNKTILKTMTSSGDNFAPNENSWLTMALDLLPSEYSAYLGQKLGISLGGQGGPRDLFYDSVSLTFTSVPIPEPASGYLIVFGGLGALLTFRQRRSRA